MLSSKYYEKKKEQTPEFSLPFFDLKAHQLLAYEENEILNKVADPNNPEDLKKLNQYGAEKLTLEQAHTKCEELQKKWRSGQTAMDVEKLEYHYGLPLNEIFDERFRYKSFYEDKINSPNFRTSTHNCNSFNNETFKR